MKFCVGYLHYGKNEIGMSGFQPMTEASNPLISEVPRFFSYTHIPLEICGITAKVSGDGKTRTIDENT
jgi:hypothetical protein